MTSLERRIALLPSKMREKTQLPKLATIDIVETSISFTQNESLIENQSSPMVLITNTTFDKELSITITYNDGSTYDHVVSQYTDIYQIFRLPISVYQVTDVVLKTLIAIAETVTKRNYDTSDELVNYASSLPATITDSDTIIYTLDTHYQLTSGQVDWDMGHDAVTGVIAHRTKATVTVIDWTTEANNATVDDVPVFPVVGDAQVSDMIYVGSDTTFNRTIFTVGQAAVGDYVLTLEYWNGADWNSSPSNISWSALSSYFRTSGKQYVSFQIPTDWVARDVTHDGGSITNKYWIRWRITALTTYTTQPLITQMWTDKEPRKNQTYPLTYDYIPSGEDGDQLALFMLYGNTAKMLYIQDYGLSQIRGEYYKMLKYAELSVAEGYWIDNISASWGLNRLGGESNTDLKQRIVGASTPTDGTIRSIMSTLVTFLGLSSTPSVIEAYDATTWLLGESSLLSNNQSELILGGGDTVKAMQFIVTITGYEGALTEAEIETYLRTIIPVGASPVVRLT